MFNRLMNWLVPKLEAWCHKTGRVLIISGAPSGKDVPYLVRCFLFRSWLFSIYIHRFMRSDKDDMHDHPFGFLSYVVKGSYQEDRMFGRTLGMLMGVAFRYKVRFKTSQRRQGSWAFRPASTTHLVKIDRSYDLSEIEKAPLTLVFRGPYTREWGFWKLMQWSGGFGDSYVEFEAGDVYQWIKWNEYLGVPDADVRE